jgi:hypothetical protein
MLLDSHRAHFDGPPALAGWKAWVLVAWIVVALAAYGASMLSWF